MRKPLTFLILVISTLEVLSQPVRTPYIELARVTDDGLSIDLGESAPGDASPVVVLTEKDVWTLFRSLQIRDRLDDEKPLNHMMWKNRIKGNRFRDDNDDYDSDSDDDYEDDILYDDDKDGDLPDEEFYHHPPKPYEDETVKDADNDYDLYGGDDNDNSHGQYVMVDGNNDDDDDVRQTSLTTPTWYPTYTWTAFPTFITTTAGNSGSGSGSGLGAGGGGGGGGGSGGGGGGGGG